LGYRQRRLTHGVFVFGQCDEQVCLQIGDHLAGVRHDLTSAASSLIDLLLEIFESGEELAGTAVKS
jgi:hypothetical protein